MFDAPRCERCRFWSHQLADGLMGNSTWAGKRELSDDEKSWGACTRAARPTVMAPWSVCGCYSPADLFAWFWNVVAFWRRGRIAQRGLDELARARDTALVVRTALGGIVEFLADTFRETRAVVRDASLDAGYRKHAHRIHAAVGLELKRLGHVRDKTPELVEAVPEIDVGRPDVLTEVLDG